MKGLKAFVLFIHICEICIHNINMLYNNLLACMMMRYIKKTKMYSNFSSNSHVRFYLCVFNKFSMNFLYLIFPKLLLLLMGGGIRWIIKFYRSLGEKLLLC